MSDITRDDLRVKQNPDYDETFVTYHRIVTDEEFDRFAREAGYCKPSDTFGTFLFGCGEWIASNRSKVLRALLTDKCDHLSPRTGRSACRIPGDASTCQVCKGRGWLPKESIVNDLAHHLMTMTWGAEAQSPVEMVPHAERWLMKWLEDEDGQE